MKSEIWAPGAQLMESMRAVGYSLTTALADVIDNSVTAGARRIGVSFSTSETPYVAIIDNGKGMDPEAARVAMQLAGTSSVIARDRADLGRFGLGLKTASLSQCRLLTLVTKTAGTVTVLRWDLDYVGQTGEWRLQILEGAEIEEIPHIRELQESASGTLVVWQRLDKILEGGSIPGRFLDEQMSDAREHLSLVFHRFLSGDAPLSKVAISINSHDLIPADPFLSQSSRTQRSDEEFIDVEGQRIAVKAFTLPFVNKMTTTERKSALVAGTLRDSQGFYVYRGGRLVIWGTWFRLMPKNESGKLTRVRVDIPNSLDHLWSLDIKKSSAVPPAAVKERLRMLASSMVRPSERIHSFRGLKDGDHSLIRPWEVVVDRDTFRYVINRDHPILQRAGSCSTQDEQISFESALQVIESSFPVQDLINRVTSDRVIVQLPETDLLKDVLLGLWRERVRHDPAADAATFLSLMLTIEPFDGLAAADGSAKWLEENREAESHG